ncbi:PREDICTED: transcription factor TGA7 [Tarenaya hassleriana]|uniref:transcription factor TGA7 n=1 Tax=Tarenaya hassleriana TaxID=28532 RepID=UPI00053C7F8B|nr:PREDICTED: transcription factor TGA7 [Tarenaya hassleriana]
MNYQNVETFDKFHEAWSKQLQGLLRHLRSAQKNFRSAAGESSEAVAEEELHGAVKRVMVHCSDYYSARRSVTEADVASMVASPWSSQLERALQWVGGWRPTAAFHLVYTESDVHFESRIVGDRIGDLSDLSPLQLRRVSVLQCKTVKEENDITEEASDWQDNASLLVPGTVDNLDDHILGLSDIVQMADNLRLATITGVVAMLNPFQAAEFLTAAAKLLTGVHCWGMIRDDPEIFPAF